VAAKPLGPASPPACVIDQEAPQPSPSRSQRGAGDVKTMLTAPYSMMVDNVVGAKSATDVLS
jgi:hypothetical protein